MPPEAFAPTGGTSPVLDMLAVCVLCGAAYRLASSSADQDPPIANMPRRWDDPTAEEQEEARSTFGWFHADMRTPLPSLEELQQACHQVGTHEGHYVYLCGSHQPADARLGSCLLSDDFTQFYKSPIYVCKGRKVLA